MNSAHSFTEGMDVPNTISQEEKDFLNKAITEAYEKGYAAAGNNLKTALNLLPDPISKNHIFRLIDIVQKVSNSK